DSGLRRQAPDEGRYDEVDVRGSAVDGPLGAVEVEHEGEELDAVGLVRLQATEHLCRIGHLRNLLRVDEGTDLDLPQSRGDELLGQRDLGLGGHDRLLDLETVAQSGVEDVDGVRPDHGTPSHMFPNNGTLLAPSRLCEGSLSLYSALISDNRLCSSCESAGRIDCRQSRLSGSSVLRPVRLDRVACFEFTAVDEFQVDDVTQSGEEVGSVAGDAGVDDEFELVDEAEFGQRERQRHSPDRKPGHGLFLELADCSSEIVSDEF